jgi:hypothetical protein
MQDLVQTYVDDLNRLRDAFHEELAATAGELSKAMDIYAHRSEAALASLMEKASARGEEFEAAVAKRFNQFRGLLPNGDWPNVDDRPVADTPTDTERSRTEAAAERAVGAGLQVENDGDRKLSRGQMTLVKSGPAA